MTLYIIKYKATKVGKSEIIAKNKKDAMKFLTTLIKVRIGEIGGKVKVKALNIKEIK